MATEYDIERLLDEWVDLYGASVVRAGCRRFMLRKTLANGGTKRKPIKREWTMLAYDKQGGLCARCYEDVPVKKATGDHLISLATGGKHTKNNIRMLCGPCNSSKGANDLVKESKLTGQTILQQVESLPLEDEDAT